MDSAYKNTPNRYLKTFSSQNACTFLNKRLFLNFFLTTTIYQVKDIYSTVYYDLSYDVASESEIRPRNKIDKPLVVYRFTGNVMMSKTTLRK